MENVSDAIQVLDSVHLIGVSLLIVTLIGMTLYFAWKVIREILKRKDK